ncbi:MAG: tetratricopeptide repeat protein [Terriglobia bacterium]
MRIGVRRGVWAWLAISVMAAAPAFGAQAASFSQLETQAHNAVARGDSPTAIRDYEQLVRRSPRNPAFQEGLGIAFYTSGKPSDAVAPLERALKLKPSLGRDGVFPYFLGASLGESGRCPAALPYLLKDPSALHDASLKRAVEIDGVRCAMTLDRQSDALEFLSRLHRDFPKDAAALYLTVHVYSDLSTRAAQKLLVTNPGSYQVHELDAESLEMQGKWAQAEQQYRRVLALKPGLAGAHYLLGRAILSAPKTPTTYQDAAKEFEAELKIDPQNGGAEFVLGEIAREESNWDEAIRRFKLAVQFDPQFAPAFLELGRTLVTTGKAVDAITPLQSAVKLSPANPEGHFMLAMAYRRAGRTADAEREMAVYQRTTSKAQQNMQHIRSSVTGRTTPAEASQPSNP